MNILIYTDDCEQESIQRGERTIFLDHSGLFYEVEFKTPDRAITELKHIKKYISDGANREIIYRNHFIIRSVASCDIVAFFEEMKESKGLVGIKFNRPMPFYDLSENVNITSHRSIIKYQDHYFLLMIYDHSEKVSEANIIYYDNEPTDQEIKESIKKRMKTMIEDGLICNYPLEDYTYWITGLTDLSSNS